MTLLHARMTTSGLSVGLPLSTNEFRWHGLETNGHTGSGRSMRPDQGAHHAPCLPVHAAPAAPAVVGPLPVNATPGAGVTRDYPFFASQPQYDLEAVGYREEELFVQGFARAYQTPSMADGVVLSTGNPYKTRIIVKRPAHPARFNGVVMVEWDNVTSGYGIPLHWQHSRDHLTRAGYVHVSVQAQRVGVHQTTTGLRDWSPTRYGSLDVTAGGTVMDDSLSYDIFSQVVVAPRGAAKSQLLPGLAPKVVIAVGQSQSAGRLTSYYRSIQPLHKSARGDRSRSAEARGARRRLRRSG